MLEPIRIVPGAAKEPEAQTLPQNIEAEAA
ncbi:MAG: hypothetical protein JWR77_409, partial [Rhizorhabdus sp.]|nr:hypothetical protein [Rhizorhabdus sp.]